MAKRTRKNNKTTAPQPIRVAKEFVRIVKEEQAKALLAGRIIPTSAKVTRKIAKRIREVGL